MNIKMKNYQPKLPILALALLFSWEAQAGNLPNPFVDGQVLTFGDMEDIRNAVNDNDIRAIANEGDVFSNTAAIANLFGGDGSAGDLTVTVSENWNTTPPANPYFNNITIDAGQTLTVPAGATIRCSGTFTNNGTLRVLPGADLDGPYSINQGSTSTPTMGLMAVAHPGDTPRAASLGEYSTPGSIPVDGGRGGGAIPPGVAASSFANFRIGGGAGAGYDNQGAQGGGLVKVYCAGPIVNAGTINARGENGTNTSIGGGGGGIVVLASRTSVDNSAGTIDVGGGNSSSGSGNWGGNSGGGGGGIVIMASPVAPVPGIETVTGGTGGTDTGTVSTTVGRTGGAGGGGSGGEGGSGGNVSGPGAKSAGSDGSIGYTLTFTYDPIFIAR